MTNVQKHFSLDESLAKDIVAAVSRSMSETFSVAVTADPPEFGDGMVSLVGDISGIIGMVQQHLEGTLILCMTNETVRGILPQVIGGSVPVTHEMAVDAVGELTNMIFGQVKSDLNQRDHQIKLGIPCVVTGRGHFVSQFHRGKYMIVPFHVEGQLFQVYVAVHDSKDPSGRQASV